MVDETTKNGYDELQGSDESESDVESTKPAILADEDDLRSGQSTLSEADSTGTGEHNGLIEKGLREEVTGSVAGQTTVSTSAEFYGLDKVRAKRFKANLVEEDE